MCPSQVILPREKPARLELFQGRKRNVIKNVERQPYEDRLKQIRAPTLGRSGDGVRLHLLI